MNDMDDMDDKLIQMARECGAESLHGAGKSVAMTPAQLAAFRSAILADAAKDVQAVAWRFRWNPQGDWHITSHEPRGGDGTNKEPLYSATTLAAAQALNAELVALEGGPWFYLQLNDFVYKVGSKKPAGGVYRFDGTYVRLKNGSGRFSGRTRTIIRSTENCLI